MRDPTTSLGPDATGEPREDGTTGECAPTLTPAELALITRRRARDALEEARDALLRLPPSRLEDAALAATRDLGATTLRRSG